MHNRACITHVQRIQLLHIPSTQLKPIYVRILLDPTLRIALWQRHPVLLQTIPYQDLRRRLVMRLCEREQCGIVSFVIADQRRIGLYNDRVMVAVGDDSALLAPRVELYSTQAPERVSEDQSVPLPVGLGLAKNKPQSD